MGFLEILLLYSDRAKKKKINQQMNVHSDSKNFKTYQHTLRDVKEWLIFQDYCVEWGSNSDKFIWRPDT